MAKSAILNININSGEAKKTLGDLNKEAKLATTNVASLGKNFGVLNKDVVAFGTAAIKGFKAIPKQIEEVTTKSISLKAQLRAMKAELLNLEENSPAFNKLAREASELQDRIGDVNSRVKAFASDTKKLDTTVGVVNGIGASFQAVTGIMALMGSESSVLQEAMQKIVITQGILNGVNEVARILNKEHIVGAQIKIALDKAQAISSAGLTKVMGVLNAVMAANPISLIVIGIGLLVAAIIAFRKPIMDFISSWENIKTVLLALLGPIGWIIIAYQKLFGEEAKQANAREKASKENTERFKKEVAELKEKRRLEHEAFTDRQTQFDLQIARLEAEGKSSKALTRAKLEAIITEKKAALKLNEDLIQATVDRYTFEASLRGMNLKDFLASIGIQYDATEKQLTELFQKQKDSIYSAETDLIAFNTQASKGAKAPVDFVFPDAEELKEESKKVWTSFLEYWNEGKLPMTVTIDEDDIVIEDETFVIEPETEVAYGKIKQLWEDIKTLNDTGAKVIAEKIHKVFENVAKQFGTFSEFFTQAMDIFNQALDMQAQAAARSREYTYSDETEELKSQLANREINQKEYDNKLRLINQEKREEEKKAARKEFQRNKANNIVNAVMSTAQAVLQALASLPPPASFVMAGINAALGAAQIAVVSSQKFTAARGGLVAGAASNVDTVDAKLARGEAVINSKSTAAFAPLLSAINEMGGGISFAPNNILESSISSTRESSFRQNRESINITAHVVEHEMTRTQKRVKRMENGAVF